MNGRSVPAMCIVAVFAAIAWRTDAAVAMEPESGESGKKHTRFVWFGTYTQGKTEKGLESEGIYVSRFDDATGDLSGPQLAARVVNPSFLARHPTRPVLYAVSEVEDRSAANGRATGHVVAFRIDPASGMLTKLNDQPSGGGSPCHVAVDPSGRCVLAANYSGGNAICLRVADDGSLAPVVEGSPGGLVQHVGKTDEAAGHAAPHAYVINELALTITAFDWDAKQGTLREIATVSTLPADVTARKGMSTAEVVTHPSGRFLYGSNRGHDTIAMFKLDAESGKPEWIDVEPIRGKTPRAFSIDPSGRWLLVAGQTSDSVTSFSIDPESGRLAFTGRSIDVPRPVCLLFGDSMGSALRSLAVEQILLPSPLTHSLPAQLSASPARMASLRSQLPREASPAPWPRSGGPAPS